MKMTPLSVEDTSIDAPKFSVDQLIANLVGLLETGIKIPFTSKTVIDEERFFDAVDELRKVLPAEFERAREVVSRESTIIADAQNRAETLMQQAHAHVQSLVSQEEIVRMATEEASRIQEDAQRSVAQQISEADRYAEEVLGQLETKIARALDTIQNGRNALAKP
ncbi:MAG: hypothetical protein VKP72_00365 [bacterium]|nr:hypothetical protein [bacterium]